jgi:hypothetical protein
MIVYNCAFYGVDIRFRENWIKARNFTVYAPVIISFALITLMIALFLSDLDKLHEVINNSYPVPKEDLRTSITYTALVFILLVLPPLFHNLSFFAYVRDLGLYYDGGKNGGDSPVDTGEDN